MLFRTAAALLVASAAAFSPSMPASVRPAMVQTSTARHIVMSDRETRNLMDSAQDCIDSECSIDEVSSLLDALKSSERDLENRLEEIMNMISHLQHINEKEERQTDEVRAFVQDMLRVFNTDKPSVLPAGFSGDVKKHLDAYNSLPPKPWKPTA